MAQELQIGRNTVENAYAQLVLKGYITSILGSGYVVNNLQFNLNPKIPINIEQEGILDINGKPCDTNTKYESVNVCGTAKIIDNMEIKAYVIKK